jgi:hypothetical protein
MQQRSRLVVYWVLKRFGDTLGALVFFMDQRFWSAYLMALSAILMGGYVWHLLTS